MLHEVTHGASASSADFTPSAEFRGAKYSFHGITAVMLGTAKSVPNPSLQAFHETEKYSKTLF